MSNLPKIIFKTNKHINQMNKNFDKSFFTKKFNVTNNVRTSYINNSLNNLVIKDLINIIDEYLKDETMTIIIPSSYGTYEEVTLTFK